LGTRSKPIDGRKSTKVDEEQHMLKFCKRIKYCDFFLVNEIKYYDDDVQEGV
jgi:hypothetical protein